MKITITLAQEVAKKMCKATIGQKITLIDNELKEFTYRMAVTSIDEELWLTFLKYKKYFMQSNYCIFAFNNLKTIGSYLKDSIPITEIGHYPIKVSREDYEKLVSLDKDKNTLLEEQSILYTKIKSTIFSLGTFKRVQEQFKECLDYWPSESLPSDNTSISLPIDNIRESLSKYQ